MKYFLFQIPATADDWRGVAEEFKVKWNYPCCIGTLDGKHVAIQQPGTADRIFFLNYEHLFSLLFLALVDANYKFMYVDVGASGRAGDGGMFSACSLKESMDNNTLNLPPAETIQGIPTNIHYHIVADDAFPLSLNILKPYPQRNLDRPKRIFNYRLSRSRRVVENAFGILANRFRVFLTTINLRPDKVTNAILAACCLHNVMVENSRHVYISARDVDDTTGHTITDGDGRQDQASVGMPATSNRNASENAKKQRQELTEYVSSLGSVPRQDEMTGL